MRVALGVEYDGSRFCGWQSQPSGCGVQDALERALSAIASEPVRVVTAGRTDAGVHALHQVVHFDTAAARPDSAWVRGVNALLPDSVGVLWAQPVGEEFHARFSAISRRYLYLLHNHPVRPALLSGKVGWFHTPLDVEAMRQGARHLLGEHDFSAFRAAECQAKTPVKHIQKITVARDGDYVLFDFTANAFLHHMVRNLVGSLVYVGKGKHPPAWIGELLENRDRTRSAPTFAPDGLYLAGIGYDSEWGIPALSRMPDFAFR
ncbi:MAG TPA: tRNA pseudouridine(38-40) synthase TruA [Sulfuricella sp.]|nr:tRNA pseudouridine(38-40) synthase TruA [Sulfuricella sp.]